MRAAFPHREDPEGARFASASCLGLAAGGSRSMAAAVSCEPWSVAGGGLERLDELGEARVVAERNLQRAVAYVRREARETRCRRARPFDEGRIERAGVPRTPARAAVLGRALGRADRHPVLDDSPGEAPPRVIVGKREDR